MFLPKNFGFFDLFDEQLAEISKALAILRGLKGKTEIDREARHIKDIEHVGDLIAHRILETLNKTFITPIEKEDISAIAHGLDDILDDVERVANRMHIYKLVPIPPVVFQFLDIIEKSVIEIGNAIHLVKDDKKRHLALEKCTVINTYENEGDDLLRASLGKLLDEEKDPILIIKLKEIIETLESATDCCEDVADILESIVVKYY